MSDQPSIEWAEKIEFIATQVRETVRQEAEGVGCRTSIVTCRCGTRRALVLMYKCLYCGEWYCTPCAEQHFGKTVAQYRAENPIYRPGDAEIGKTMRESS